MMDNTSGADIKRRTRQRVGHVLVLFGALAALVAPAAVVHAASPGPTITTSPVSASLSTTPGGTVSTDLQLQNSGTKAVQIAVKLEKFKAAGEDGQAQIYVPPTDDPSLSWVHFSESTFVAEPGVWKKIHMTVNVPKSAAFGYYYAVVFAPVRAMSAVPSANTFQGANAVLVLLNVHTTGAQNRLAITSFTADQHVYQFLPVNFTVKVHNSGDLYAAPHGNIFISRSKGGPVIDTLEVNQGLGNVLPDTNRIFQTVWSDGFPVPEVKRTSGQIVTDSSGKPIQQLSWDLSKLKNLRFGQYYARLVLVYSDNGRDVPMEATVSFWVIPWSIILAILVIVGLLLVGLWTIVRTMLGRRPRRIHLR